LVVCCDLIAQSIFQKHLLLVEAGVFLGSAGILFFEKDLQGGVFLDLVKKY